MFFSVGVALPAAENEAFGLVVPALCNADFGCVSAADSQADIAPMVQDAVLSIVDLMVERLLSFVMPGLLLMPPTRSTPTVSNDCWLMSIYLRWKENSSG